MPDGVVFTDAREERFYAVILATGFRRDLRRLISGQIVRCFAMKPKLTLISMRPEGA